jgi:hypothetical protein
MKPFVFSFVFLFAFSVSAQQKMEAQLDSIQPGQLVINEILAINQTTMDDFYGEFDDWIELYNNTPNILSLDWVFLSDSYIYPLKWYFPLGTTINPHSFVIVWADGDVHQVVGFHAPFRLSGEGEQVILSYLGGKVIDSVSFGPQVPDISWGRYPNGTGPFMALIPTFAANNTPLSVASGNQFPFRMYPNPVQHELTLEISKPEDFANLQIINSLGQVIVSAKPERSTIVELSGISPGLYYVRLNSEKITVIRQFIKL